MNGELNRYFIELLPQESEPVPRYRETELRRETAVQFIETVNSWLQQNELISKVTNMAVTALGQVQITCEPDIIHQIRNRDLPNIVTIRQGAMPSEGGIRWHEAR